MIAGKLAEYVLTGRPETTNRHVFLRELVPRTELAAACSIYEVTRRVFKAAGVDGTRGDPFAAPQRRDQAPARGNPIADDLGGAGPLAHGIHQHLSDHGHRTYVGVRPAAARGAATRSATVNGAGFTSVFAADLERFLAFKKSMGFHGNGREWYLRNFDRYCTENGLEEFDGSTVEGWILSKQPSLTDSFPSWRSFIRDFGRWLLFSGNENAYVLSDRWKTSNARTQPYLLRSEEIIKFFDAAPRLETKSAWKWQGLAFFALMHSCGLRTWEVRKLDLEDVNLAEGVIDVRWSKGSRSRQLPITDQLLTILAAANQALELAAGKQRTAFFVNQSGH